MRDFLERFRPAGAPGAAAAAVPADRRAELAAELEVVFARLGAAERERERLLEVAASDADRIRAEAQAAAAAVVADAREWAGTERATVAARVRTAVLAESAELIAEARCEADAVRQAAEARLAGHVARAVDMVREIAR
ncbi:MAG: hypothetical protein ACRDOO_17345 [Actinomadura sp.]